MNASKRVHQLAEFVLSLLEGLNHGPPMLEERPPIRPNGRRHSDGNEIKLYAEISYILVWQNRNFPNG